MKPAKKGDRQMIYAKALMIIRNATSGYSATEIREAACFVLGTLSASEDDILDASSALGYAETKGVRAVIPNAARCSDLDAHPFAGFDNGAR